MKTVFECCVDCTDAHPLCGGQFDEAVCPVAKDDRTLARVRTDRRARLSRYYSSVHLNWPARFPGPDVEPIVMVPRKADPPNPPDPPDRPPAPVTPCCG